MRIPLTKYGMPQVLFYPAMCILVMLIIFFIVHNLCAMLIIEAIFLSSLIWLLSFFRDPKRDIPQGDNLILSPADGTVADIEVIDEAGFIESPATRIGIFLSIFNVHINRVPCDVRIEKIEYHKGSFLDARDPNCGKLNESNDIGMTRLKAPNEKILVRQISGAIARRIVCDARVGREFSGGQVFGMIKFGSRTEIYLPANSGTKILVNKGDKVKAGLTILAKYE